MLIIIADGEESWFMVGMFATFAGAVILTLAIIGTVACNKVYTKQLSIASMEAGETFVIKLDQKDQKYYVKDLETGLPIEHKVSNTKIVKELEADEQPYLLTEKKHGTFHEAYYIYVPADVIIDPVF